MKLAIVVPRYGKEVLGGAETLARQLAEHLPRAEFSVEILTTCADDARTWRNVHPPGLTCIHDVPVRRFPIDLRGRSEGRYQELTNKFTNRWPTTVDEEYEWIEQSGHSPELYAHIARHGREYDLLLFVPYVFGLIFYASAVDPARSIICPCLHDESFARFLQTRLMLQSCRGIMFNSEPEMAFAEGKLGIHHPRARCRRFRTR